MKHSHKSKEERMDCARSFGECWQNPKVERLVDQSNTPRGESGLNKWKQV